MTTTTALDSATIDRIACDVRRQIAPGLAIHDRLPLAGVRGALSIEGADGRFDVRGGVMAALPRHIWGLTCFDGPRALLWFHRVAWREIALEVERSRWSAGHEIGHVALHAHTLRSADGRHETPKMEREANIFCAHLLVPDDAIRRLWSPAGAPAVSDIAGRFACSPLAATRRLDEFRAAM